MTTLERLLATENNDIQEIVRGILLAQSRFAAKQKRDLARGTHAKGVCVRGTFEVFDIEAKVSDPALARRLAQGFFARPGVYPATVRFANASSTIQPDYKGDVRAISFAVDVPAGVVGAAATRLDFSMNNSTTFAINNAHDFAILMRVLQAGGIWGTLKALFSLSPGEWVNLIKTGIRGARQLRGKARPYQTLRYWSNVPFRHGPDDAIKYSATALSGNPAEEPPKSAEMLRDELLRHLEKDSQMSAFDFGLQLLDVDRMSRGSKKKDAIYWVENASVEWDEKDAPFHVVGKLTLAPKSRLTPAECDEFYIDVTQHSTPDSHPIGSINRARWFAESASRRARLKLPPPTAVPVGHVVDAAMMPDARTGAPLPAPAIPLRPWVGRITIRSVFRLTVLTALAVIALVTALGAATMIYLHNGGGMLPAQQVDSVTYPDRGWGPGLESADRQKYYFTPQGAGLKDIRYSWFVNLEMPFGTQRLADPAVLGRYGFLVDEPTPANPDRLPVGFTKHFDRQLNEELLDITCAACHTGQIQITRDGRTRAMRIDGGSAIHAFTDSNFGSFLPTLIASLTSTAANPFKFNRFARRVLGSTYPEGRWTLHKELRSVIGTFLALAWNEKVHGLSPTQEGFGRTDALARIANTVFAENLVAINYAVGNAPVSYPPVWNIWKFDWVQYNASVSQPMARNIGESMGVGAKYALVDRYGRPLPPAERFRSTANIQGLRDIELTLWKLQPPEWPEDMLGAIDVAKAKRGEELFEKHCEKCHGPFTAPPALKTRNAPLKKDYEPEWLVRTVCVGDIGTDPNTALNFANSEVDITRTGLTAADLRQVARSELALWNQRQAVYLKSEIARLGLLTTPEAAKQKAAFEVELAALGKNMEQTLSQIDPAKLSVGAALSYLGTLIRKHAYADLGYSQAQQDEMDGFGILDLPQVIYAYKPRPLAGIWATPPFLHNGSVPTVYDLLTPAAQRPKTFQAGSREYDPVKLGLAQVTGYWTFDTSLDGNRNTGHEFKDGYVEADRPSNGHIGPLLSHEDKLAIIEHLKVRNDDRDGPKDPKIPPTPTASAAVPCAMPPKAKR